MNVLSAPSIANWSLDPESEYRFELEGEEAIAIRVIDGQAELFGAELAPKRWHYFVAGYKGAVFSWEGCTLEMSPPLLFRTPSTEYLSKETNLPALSNLHLTLESRRLRSCRHQLERAHAIKSAPSKAERDRLQREDEWLALAEEEDAPRVMVLGPEGAGKTSVCQTLINWTTRPGRGSTPVFVNLDPSEGIITPPGTLSLTPIQHAVPASSPASIFGSPLPTGPPPSLASTLLPLSWYYGYASPGQPGRTQLWTQLVDDMGRRWEERRKCDRVAASAGLVVDTSGRFVEPGLGKSEGEGGEKYRLVRQVVDAFKINILIVVGHEKLQMEMHKMFGGPTSRTRVVKLPKSGGVVDHDALYRSRAQALQIRSYFYGDATPPPTVRLEALAGNVATVPLPLAPHSTSIKFDDLAIYRVGEEFIAPSSALPIGAARTISETQLLRVDPSLPAAESKLLNAVLALVRAPEGTTKAVTDATQLTAEGAIADVKPGEVKAEVGVAEGEDGLVEGELGEELARSEIAGFVVVTAIDLVRRKLTILSPSPGKLPSRTALVGGLEWQEM